MDKFGNVYIADLTFGGSQGTIFGNRVRKVDAITGYITTVAGDGTYNVDQVHGSYSEDKGYGFFGNFPSNGDGGNASSAKLYNPVGLDVDSNGNIYIVEKDDVRVVWAATGKIDTIAGSKPSLIADGFPPYRWSYPVSGSKTLYQPRDVTVDKNGNLYIVDSGHKRILKQDAAGNVSVVADNLISPLGVTVDAAGNVYIVDSGNNTIPGKILKVSTAGKITTLLDKIRVSDLLVDPLTGDFYYSGNSGLGRISLHTITVK